MEGAPLNGCVKGEGVPRHSTHMACKRKGSRHPRLGPLSWASTHLQAFARNFSCYACIATQKQMLWSISLCY